MNILSLQESDSLAQEAKHLCHSIESRQEELRKAGFGRKISIDNAIFTVIQADRNIVYRIKKDHSWYLKMPHSGSAEPILREMAGAQNIINSLPTEEGYSHPSVVRGSVDASYVLYSEIVGQQLNIAFYSHCFLPFLGRSKRLQTGFSNFGQALGVLHQTKPSTKDPVATRDLVSEVLRTLKEINQSDLTLDLIDSYVNKNNIKPAPPSTFIHGNLKMENVLFGSTKISFIDFENCGYGSPYEDLSWPASQIILTRSIFGFPWKIASQALSKFLESYKSNVKYERKRLLQYIILRISLYYIQIILGKFGRPTIAGLPIRISSLQRMISELIAGNCGKAIPGVTI